MGAIEDDPDCLAPGLSYQVPKARVLRVIKITEQQRAIVVAALMADLKDHP